MRTSGNPIITFIASNETMGDGTNPETMDYFMGVRFPWLSLAVPKLREIGHDVEVVNWQDKNVDWSKKSFAVFGPVWGYSNHPKDFEAWLNSLQKTKIVVHNSLKFIRWNFKKSYLLDLQNRGIDTPPTLIIDPSSKDSLQDVVTRVKKQWGTSDVIIKGVIDAGALGYKHVRSGTIDEHETHFNDLKSKNSGAVVQPFLQEIMRVGEYAFVFFNEDLSHGFLKVPKSGEERVQPEYNGKNFHFRNDEIVDRDALVNFRSDIIAPLQEEIQSARIQSGEISKKLSKLLQGRDINPPLYVRIDGIMSHGKFLVMEIEGFEPDMEMGESVKINPANNAVDKYIRAIDLAYRKEFDQAC